MDAAESGYTLQLAPLATTVEVAHYYVTVVSPDRKHVEVYIKPPSSVPHCPTSQQVLDIIWPIFQLDPTLLFSDDDACTEILL